MASINIPINNGTGSQSVANGNYNVTVTSVGYDVSTLNPSTINVVEGTNDYSFTVGATGTLTIHVSDDGTATGNPIVGAVLYRTDSDGTTYGDPITTDCNGNAVFENVPYAATNAPTIYFKQTESDGSHDFRTDVLSTNMTTETYTYELENSLSAVRTITLTDSNYENLPIDNATINLSNE